MYILFVNFVGFSLTLAMDMVIVMCVPASTSKRVFFTGSRVIFYDDDDDNEHSYNLKQLHYLKNWLPVSVHRL